MTTSSIDEGWVIEYSFQQTTRRWGPFFSSRPVWRLYTKILSDKTVAKRRAKEVRRMFRTKDGLRIYRTKVRVRRATPEEIDQHNRIFSHADVRHP